MACYPDSTDWSCYPGGDVAVAELDDDLKAWAEEMAWRTLSALTAGQIAVCPVLARPCPSRVYSRLSRPGFLNPIYNRGQWTNAHCGTCFGNCGHPLGSIVLPGPIGGIVEVKIDGLILPSTAYRVDNGAYLVRQDGGVWPSTQNLTRDDSQEGTWSVAYYRGAMPDALTNRAAGVLAFEYVKACRNASTCRLPSGVTSITRQGVSMEIQTGMFEGGYTGISDVDTVIRIFNPYGLKAPPVIMSPDTRRTRITQLGAPASTGGFGQGGFGI